jgi:micrococcal nuclease
MTLYYYNAVVLRVVDGDTLDLEISLGMNVCIKERIRIRGINAPETYGVKKESEEYQKGMVTKNRLIDLILGEKVQIHTHKDKKGKYGRYIADVYLVDGTSVGETLIKEGLAERKDYK